MGGVGEGRGKWCRVEQEVGGASGVGWSKRWVGKWCRVEQEVGGASGVGWSKRWGEWV